MGQAKQRKAAHDAGRPWAPKMPAAVSSAGGTSSRVREMERLGHLSQVAEVHTRESLRAARAATDDDARFAALHAIEVGAMGMYDGEVEFAYNQSAQNQQLRQSLACRKGCSFCCHLAVECTILEAILVWRRASQTRPLAEAVQKVGPQVANLAPKDRWSARVACPMLGADGACQVYEDRPGACRAFVSLDAERCEAALRAAGSAEQPKIPSVPFPRKIETAISIGIRRAFAAENLQSCNVELTSALYLLANDAGATRRWLAGETVFKPYP